MAKEDVGTKEDGGEVGSTVPGLIPPVPGALGSERLVGLDVDGGV